MSDRPCEPVPSGSGKSNKQRLPPGWKTKKSRKGRLYFINSSKQVSFHTLPEVLAYQRACNQHEKNPTVARQQSGVAKSNLPAPPSRLSGHFKPFSIQSKVKKQKSGSAKAQPSSGGQKPQEARPRPESVKKRSVCQDAQSRAPQTARVKKAEVAANASTVQGSKASAKAKRKRAKTTKSSEKIGSNGRSSGVSSAAKHHTTVVPSPSVAKKSVAGQCSAASSSGSTQSAGVRKQPNVPVAPQMAPPVTGSQKPVSNNGQCSAEPSASTAGDVVKCPNVPSGKRKSSARRRSHRSAAKPYLRPTGDTCTGEKLAAPSSARSLPPGCSSSPGDHSATTTSAPLVVPPSVPITPPVARDSKKRSTSDRVSGRDQRVSLPAAAANSAAHCVSVSRDQAVQSSDETDCVAVEIVHAPAVRCRDRETSLAAAAESYPIPSLSSEPNTEENNSGSSDHSPFSTDPDSSVSIQRAPSPDMDISMDWETEPLHSTEAIVAQVNCWRSTNDALVSFPVPAGCLAPARAGSPSSIPSAPSPTPSGPSLTPSAPSSTPSAESVHVVLDTNVLIKSIDFVSELRHSVIKGAFPTLIVPWIVFQELDKLKSSTRHLAAQDDTTSSSADRPGGAVAAAGVRAAQTVGAAARRAVTFLLACLQSGDPRVKGQTVREAAVADSLFHSRLPDDRVLKCCLAQLTSVHGHGLLQCVLLTEDKSLAAKALVHSVTALSCHQLVTSSGLLCDVRHPIAISSQCDFGQVLRLLLRCILSHLIDREMSACHGARWTAAQLLGNTAAAAPPFFWSSRVLLATLARLRHSPFRRLLGAQWRDYVTVFSQALAVVWSPSVCDSLASRLLTLVSHLTPASHYQSLTSVLRDRVSLHSDTLAPLLPSVGRLAELCCIDSQSQCQRVGVASVTTPSTLEQHHTTPCVPTAPDSTPTFTPVFARAADNATDYAPPSPCTLKTRDQTMHEPSVVAEQQQQQDKTTATTAAAAATTAADQSQECLDVFQHLWNYLHMCCGVLMDQAGLSHTLHYAAPDTLPSAEQCREFAPQISALVTSLHYSLKRLLDVSVVSLHETSAPLLATLHSVNTILAQHTQWRRMSASQLILFLRQPQNRLLLGAAITQLAVIRTSLHQAGAELVKHCVL